MEHPVVFFDGVCNLCSGSVQWVIRHDPGAIFKFTSLQGEYAKKMITDEKLKKVDSVILLENGRFYSRSTAILRIARRLGFPASILYVLIIVPAFIRNWVYDFIARHRYKWYGKMEACWLPTPDLKKRFID